MNEPPIQIRKPEVARAIRELAEKKGQPITEAVADAVHDALKKIDGEREAEVQRRLRAIEDVVERFNALPVVGPMLTDDDLYDADGLPK